MDFALKLLAASPFLLIPAAVISIFVLNAKRLAKLRAQNYAWYAQTYPDRVVKGRVTCHQCGGGHLRTERLMNRTFLRRHFCSRCGTTLYYSPESD